VHPVTAQSDSTSSEGHLFLSPMLIPLVAIIAWAAIKITRINAARSTDSASDLTGRVEELERGLQGVQQQLAETQERLDFAERLLARGKEERRAGGS